MGNWGIHFLFTQIRSAKKLTKGGGLGRNLYRSKLPTQSGGWSRSRHKPQEKKPDPPSTTTSNQKKKKRAITVGGDRGWGGPLVRELRVLRGGIQTKIVGKVNIKSFRGC